MSLIGCHITKKYGILNGLKALTEIGGSACQIQLKSVDINFIETETDIPNNEVKEIRKYVNNNNIHLINHSIHKINLAKNPYENMTALKSLANDIVLVSELGGKGSVVHMGKKINQSYELSIDNMIKSLELVYDMIKKSSGKILLENSAGEGTALYTIEDMSIIYNRLLPEVQDKIEFVIDTCHSYAAGYDLTSITKVNKFYNLIEDKLKWSKVNCVHLNDSYEPLDSHKDRHQNLLLGYISCNNNNIKGMINLIQMIKKINKPIILETDPCLHIAEIQIIKNL